VKTFWRNRRRHSAAGLGAREKRVCIATGEMSETLDTNGKNKRVFPAAWPQGQI